MAARLGAFQHVAQGHRLHLVVGHFHAHGGLAGDGRLDAHALGGEVQGNVVGKRGDAAHLHARRGLQFKARHRRAVGDAGQARLDAEGAQRVAQKLRLFHVALVAFVAVGGLSVGKQVDGRVGVGLLVLRLRRGSALLESGQRLFARRRHVEGGLVVRQFVFVRLDGQIFGKGGLFGDFFFCRMRPDVLLRLLRFGLDRLFRLFAVRRRHCAAYAHHGAEGVLARGGGPSSTVSL